MKHTNEFLAACFAAHMHSKAVCIDNTDEIMYLVGVVYLDADTASVTLHPEDSYPNDYQVSECKLVLRHLSAITEEDAIEVAKILGFTENLEHANFEQTNIVCVVRPDAYNVDLIFDCENKKIEVVAWDQENGYDLIFNSETIDFLRSKGYDCGFRHIPSLIEAGIAIAADKTHTT